MYTDVFIFIILTSRSQIASQIDVSWKVMETIIHDIFFFTKLAEKMMI